MKAEYEMVDTEAGNKNFNASEQIMNSNLATSFKPHKGTTLEWKNMQYNVPSNEKDGSSAKMILSNMSGVARPGELLAVMGTSGAGKSTLLDVLAGRLESPYLTGSLLVNGRPVDKKSFRRETGYVMQSDALFPLLTVRETIRYAAQLRIADKTSAEKDEIVDQVISLLKLQKCADTIIGDDDHRGLSGGEKRRVSIAVDIVHFPSIIFLDEPTSGLDSSTALSIIESLKGLAVQMNCTVVMTIHQPSARLFELVDNVTFLSLGRITYAGRVSELSNYINKVYKEADLGAPPMGNLPEIFLDLSDQLLSEKRVEILTSKFEEQVISQKSLFSQGDDAQVSAYANNFFYETGILMHRGLTNILRTPELFLGRVFASIFFGILIGTLFLNTDTTEDGLNHRLSYFVFVIAFYYYTSLEALPIFFTEREIYQREYSRGAYRALSYLVSGFVVQFPFQLAISFLFTCITWWLVNLPNDAGRFFFMNLITFTVLVAGNTFAMMMSVFVPNPMAGQTLGSALFSVMFLFSGFFIKKSQIPKYWLWLHYSSLFKYAYDSMIVNAFKDAAHTDDTGLSNAQVLHLYSVNGVNVGMGVGILWGWIFFFRIIMYYRLITAFTGSRK